MGIWKSGKDTLHNGIVIGILLGIALVWGQPVYDWIVSIIPTTWDWLGTYTIPIIVIGIAGLVGYIVDRY